MERCSGPCFFRAGDPLRSFREATAPSSVIVLRGKQGTKRGRDPGGATSNNFFLKFRWGEWPSLSLRPVTLSKFLRPAISIVYGSLLFRPGCPFPGQRGVCRPVFVEGHVFFVMYGGRTSLTHRCEQGFVWYSSFAFFDFGVVESFV